MKKFAAALLLTALIAPSFALAQDHDHGGGPHRDWHPDKHWRGDIHAFRDRDINYWHTGHWFHGHHSGRLGWWWVLGPNFYFYPAPVYPFPDPFIPSIVAPAPTVIAPPPVVAVPPPAIVAPSPAVSYWYFCHNPRGYYPYVPACYGRWHAVPVY
jgi:hypothetical protein